MGLRVLKIIRCGLKSSRCAYAGREADIGPGVEKAVDILKAFELEITPDIDIHVTATGLGT